MRTRMIYVLSMILATLLIQGSYQIASAADNDTDGVNRLTLLKSTTSISGPAGFAKSFYKAGKVPYQRFQVVATGLKQDTEYQLFVNGIALGTKKSNSTGSIEFLFTTNTGKEVTAENSSQFPAELLSVLTIENISIREKDLSVALIGEFNERDNPTLGTNDTQVLSLFNTLTMEGGKSVTLTVPVTDPDGDALTLSVSCDKGNFITVSGMTLQVSPGANDVGTYICSAKATDTFGLSTRIPFVISVTPPNKAPQIAPIPDQIVKTGEVKDIAIQATDPDGNAGLRILVSGGPAFVTLNDRGDGSGMLRISPLFTDTQGGIVNVKVVDPGGLSAQTSFTVTVQKSVVVSAVSRAKPNLFISGIGFGQAGAKVSINNVDISNRVVGQSDTSITLKGGKSRLNLKKGPNQITVTVGGITSNIFILTM